MAVGGDDMPRRIVIIQGHPDRQDGHFCHALADAYEHSARGAGHEVKNIAIAKLNFPLLRSKEDWDKLPPCPPVRKAQEEILWAEHFLIVYPLWLGGMPALLKGFFEQALRPGLVSNSGTGGDIFSKPLKGKTAHVVITTGMPTLACRWHFGIHSLNSLERSVLKLIGIKPVRESLISRVEAKPSRRQAWLDRMRACGQRAA